MFSWRKLVVLALLAVGLYGLLPQIKGFGDSFKLMGQAKPEWLGLALLWCALSYVMAGLVYIALAKKRLQLSSATVVQLASNFANRLLPAGIGAIAVNYKYLRRSRHTEGQAGAIVLLNNFLGFVGNLLLLLIFISLTSVQSPTLHRPHLSLWLSLLLLVVIVGLASLMYRRFAKKLRPVLRSFGAALAGYRRQPLRLVAALGASAGLTMCYALCLFACGRAVGLSLSLGAIFISMSVGVAGATVTPTPGGLGGAEAALVASLLIYGADRPAALATILLYRVCTFWLPLLGGGFAFVYARNREYI